MKQNLFLTLLFPMLVYACSSNNTNNAIKETINDTQLLDEGKEKIGTFSFDNKEVSGHVITQYFGKKENANFSVLCQHNEANDPANSNYELLQVTFITVKDATTNPRFKIYDGGSILPVTDPEPGIVSVVLSGVGSNFNNEEFTGNAQSTGSITVINRTINIENLALFTRTGEKKIISATLPF